MSREVVIHALTRVVLFALFAVITAACGRGSGSVDNYSGGPLTTNDIKNPSVQVPPVSSAGFHDSFSGPSGQPLAGRQPETTAATSSAWLSPATTLWRTKDGALVLDAIANRDFRAVIDVGRPRNWVRGRIVREAGRAGLVIRYSDEKNWLMVWSDGADIVAGQSAGGVFTELERRAFEWPGSKNGRYFDVIDTGTIVLAFVGGQEVMRLAVDPGNVAQGVGFFTRNTNKNRFDDFTVWAAPEDLADASFLDTAGESTGRGGSEPAGGDGRVDGADPPGGDEPAIGPGGAASVGSAAEIAALARGSEIFSELGCGNCHTVKGRDDAEGKIGPALDGVGDRARTRIPGTLAAVYLTDSIIDPTAFIVGGYSGIMPTFDAAITPGDLEFLVTYLLSLSTGGARDVTGVVDSLIGGREIDAGRSPERGPSGAVWTVEAGDWSLSGSGVTETGGARTDHRLVIDSGIDNASVSADVTWSGGFAGLVSRYTDAKNWIMAWYDPAGVIVIAIHSDQGFKEIERTEFAWGEPGTAHRMKIDDYGDIVDVWVDDVLIDSFDPGDQGPVPRSSSSGVFSKGHTGNEFSYFAIVESGNRPRELSVQADDIDVPLEVEPVEDDPQVVLPPDPALAPRYVESWRERRKDPHLAGSLDGNGYTLEAVVDDGIAHPISITFSGDGTMYVASGELADLEKGAIYALAQLPDGGFAPPVLMAVGFRRATGLLYANGSLYVSSRGVITRLRDLDDDLVADTTEEIVTGLPFGIFGVKGQATEHQTQGMRLGPDGRIYVVQGASTDRGPLTQLYEGTIFSMLADGSDIQIYATGFRNPFDIDFNSRGDMFTADNSANVQIDSKPPDELHFVRPGGDHGFPDVLGVPPPGSNVEKPLKTWFPAIAPGGLEFYDGGTLAALSEDDLLIAKWNNLQIARLRIELIDGEYVFIEEENVIVDFGTPVTDVTVAPNGDIYIADWGGGRIFRVSP